MIDMEKVANGLRHCLHYKGSCFDCPYDGPNCQNDVLDDAIAMLKEQEAVKARKKNNGIPQPWASWWYVCGDCGQEIEYHDRFCRWCGRAVKWE